MSISRPGSFIRAPKGTGIAYMRGVGGNEIAYTREQLIAKMAELRKLRKIQPWLLPECQRAISALDADTTP